MSDYCAKIWDYILQPLLIEPPLIFRSCMPVARMSQKSFYVHLVGLPNRCLHFASGLKLICLHNHSPAISWALNNLPGH